MIIKKGDNVIVRTGKDKGKTGKVLRAFPKFGLAVVAGVHIVKRHAKAKRSGQKGQIVEKPSPIDVSNLSLIDPKSNKAARVRVVWEGNKRHRVTIAGNRID